MCHIACACVQGEEHSGSVEEEELRRMRDGAHDPASSSGGGGGLGEWESTHPDAETGAGGGAGAGGGGGGGGAGQGASVPRSPSRNEGARLGKRSVEAAFGEERGEYGGGRGERAGLGGGEGMKGGEESAAAGEADLRAAANASAAAAAAAAAGIGVGAGGDGGGGGGMLSAGMGYMGRLPYVVEEGESDMVGGLKKARIIWSVELHQQFVKAVHHLGVDKAVPKKILEMMGVPGLTRENVASHLQVRLLASALLCSPMPLPHAAFHAVPYRAMPCQSHTIPTPSPCHPHAIPMPSPCHPHALPMPSPCHVMPCNGFS
ncbi:unnamed protein product [Closterium sp. Yama58-4]|nr:unnamed protein product [Closterium sp. Yama58-4]